MEIKEQGKRSHIDDYPRDWEVVQVQDVVLGFFCGPSPTCEERNVQGEHEWGVLKTTAATKENGWDWTKHKTLPKAYWGRKNLEVRRGDVIVTKAGPRHRVGVSAWVNYVPEQIIVSGKMIGLRPNTERVLPLVLAAAISSPMAQGFIDQRTTGMAESQVNFENTVLLNTPIHIPNIAEQKIITAVLSDVDGLLSGLDRLIAKKRDLKQGAMQQLLTGQTRLPGFHGEWEAKRLEEVGRSFAGGTPSTFRPDYWGGEIYWLPSGRVQNEILATPLESEITITQRGLDESAAKKIKANSVLVAITGATCGNIALLKFAAAANQSVVAIEPDAETDARFLFYSLLMERNQILSRQSGSAQGGVNLKAVKGIELRFPNQAEQTAIAEVLTEMDADLAALEQRREKTRVLKQGMMQELLTGRTRLVQPEDRHA